MVSPATVFFLHSRLNKLEVLFTVSHNLHLIRKLKFTSLSIYRDLPRSSYKGAAPAIDDCIRGHNEYFHSFLTIRIWRRTFSSPM